MDLVQAVIGKVGDLGVEAAALYFGVSEAAVNRWLIGTSIPSALHAQKVMDEGVPALDELKVWEGRQVIIGHPSYAFMEPATNLTLIAAIRHYGQDKVGYIQVEQTLIAEARSTVVRKFLKTDAKYLIMIDHDMVLPCGSSAIINGKYGANLPEPYASANFLTRFMAQPESIGIVGATYVGRNVNGKVQCASGWESAAMDASIRTNPKQGLKKEGWVATGCIRIARWVFDKMAEAAPTKFPEIIGNNGPSWFLCPPEGGEDVAFCRRAAQLGISSFLDCSLIAGHVGKFTFWPHNTKRLP